MSILTILAVVIGIMLGLSWVFFPLRIYVRTCITKSFGWDDVLVAISIVRYTTARPFLANLSGGRYSLRAIVSVAHWR